MNFEKRMKKRGNQNLDNLTPALYEKPKNHFPLWAKIMIPVGSVVLASSLALAIILPSKVTNKKSAITMSQIVKPTVEKVSKICDRNMSQLTYDSYTAFTKKFVSLMMEVNNSTEEDSLGISIPDAYLCFAITALISLDVARDDVLSYLELPNMDALRTAVREVLSVTATLYKNQNGKLMGGYNLNSIWLNPEKVSLIKEKDEELYRDLAEIFDASLYMEALTSKRANEYLKENGLKDLPTPKIELDDSNPSAMNTMSVFYCLDYFDPETKYVYKAQYNSHNHKMTYTYNSRNESVDYIEQNGVKEVYEGDDFYGSSLSIGNLNMDLFLPNSKTALPSSILDDVLDNNYHLRDSTYLDENNNVKPTNYHKVDILAPYFSLNNKPSLSRGDLSKVLPVITTLGAGERIATANNGLPMYLDYVSQFSLMKFNYDGFYSCSVTIMGYEAGSAFVPEYEQFTLKLDHPYVFEVTKSIQVNGINTSIPMVVGEIVTPTYVD